MNTKRALINTRINTRINTGYYCHLTVNTKGMGVPEYLIGFLKQYSDNTGLLFEVREIIDITPQADSWRSYGAEIDNGDTLINIISTLNVETSLITFEEYVEAIIISDISPFLTGCKFDIIGLLYTFITPEKYMGIGTGGSKSMILEYSEKHDTTLCTILRDSFNLSEHKIEDAFASFEVFGKYMLNNSIDKRNMKKVIELLNLIGIKYEIV